MYKAPLETPKNQRIPEKIAIYIIQDSSSEKINSPLQIYIKKDNQKQYTKHSKKILCMKAYTIMF